MLSSTQNYHALCRAIANRDLTEAARLLDAGAPVQKSLDLVYPPMREAAAVGFVEGMQLLFDHGASVDFRGKFQHTALMIAAFENKVEVGRWLLRHGANPFARWGEDCPGLLQAVLGAGDADFAQMMIEERPDLRDKEVHEVARKLIATSRNIKVVQCLLSAGVNPNTPEDGGDANSWLYVVECTAGDSWHPISELLLSAGADPNYQDIRGRSVLFRSVEFQSLKSMVRLLGFGADPDLPDEHGRTVRRMLNYPGFEQMRDVFEAYEAAHAARNIIDSSGQETGLKPL